MVFLLQMAVLEQQAQANAQQAQANANMAEVGACTHVCVQVQMMGLTMYNYLAI
jgi:hypothetical protein